MVPRKKEEERLIPPCCRNCVSLSENGACHADNKHCVRWRRWFREEWLTVQLAAARLQKKREENAKNGEE